MSSQPDRREKLEVIVVEKLDSLLLGFKKLITAVTDSLLAQGIDADDVTDEDIERVAFPIWKTMRIGPRTGG